MTENGLEDDQQPTSSATRAEVADGHEAVEPEDVRLERKTSNTEPMTDVTLDGAADEIELYDLQRHRNGDETAVLLMSFASGYQAIALDVDAGGQLLEVETIGHSQDHEKAVGMLEYWLQQNPKGVLGVAEDDGGGILSKLGIGGGEST